MLESRRYQRVIDAVLSCLQLIGPPETTMHPVGALFGPSFLRGSCSLAISAHIIYGSLNRDTSSAKPCA
ncbi:MAG: hypothetical protein ACK511_07340, partial [Burkholderiales bacterium]